MEIAFAVVLIALTVLSAALVLGLFVWAAIKDGEDNAAMNARVVRRRWPRSDR